MNVINVNVNNSGTQDALPIIQIHFGNGYQPLPQNPNQNNNTNNAADTNDAPSRQQLMQSHRSVLTHTRGRVYSGFAIGAVMMSLVCVLLSTLTTWFKVEGGKEFRCQDEFLWLFLLPPLTCSPLTISNILCLGRLCWMHCWTVTVVSVDVPCAVIFVSFGSSLVYTGSGTVLWKAGASLVLLAYVLSILSCLFYMKLAQMIEIEPAYIPGTISVTVGEEPKYDEGESYECGYQAAGLAGM